MSEHIRLLRALWASATPQWYKSNLPVADLNDEIQSATLLMETTHAQNKERAGQIVVQVNNLQQMVDDLERKVQQLDERALNAEVNQQWSLGIRLRQEQSGYEVALDTTRESLRKAVESYDAIQTYVEREEKSIREKTAQLLALQSQWRPGAVQQELELRSQMHRIFDTHYTLYPLKAVKDIVGILLGIIVVLVLILVVR